MQIYGFSENVVKVCMINPYSQTFVGNLEFQHLISGHGLIKKVQDCVFKLIDTC